MNNFSQNIIPAISNTKDFEKFLKSDKEYCVLLDLHISLAEQLVTMAHKAEKKVLVHLDLIHGIASDEYGCEYFCQKIKVDGIISTKGKVIEAAKRNKKIGILRIFLIDSRSLEKAIALCNAVAPDYVEVLPGIASGILPMLKTRISVPMMSGGLIKTKEEIQKCLDDGACAVTVSDTQMALG